MIFLGRFTAGALLARLPGGAHAAGVAAGAVAWFAAVFVVYLFNGLQDLPEDIANGSTRPLAHGDLPVQSAWLVAGGAGALALGLSALHPRLLCWTVPMLALGWAYSAGPFWAKRRSWSAALTTFGLGACTYGAGAAATGAEPSRRLFLFAVALSLWIALVGSVTKDLTDTRGDAVAGRRTLAVTKGRRAALAVAAGGAVGTACFLVATAVMADRSLLAPAVPLVVGAGTLVTLLIRPAAQPRTPYRTFMLSQYAAHAAVLVTVVLIR
ncbi:UbiA family prenyltransferase [Actinoplanes sp. N902-109]|uniref:UbiA family prenyltransferase n=1 Tax=Actinoplanes sp. (strain N902-109) TaxID=649831 RepID=UPI0003296235|nr:UbiA family prenyltransferase [Actinoplanes sp. N902-109]AGL20668.1 hypothetical protein L083_7158 [Actinoplanes sp. N902-109]